MGNEKKNKKKPIVQPYKEVDSSKSDWLKYILPSNIAQAVSKTFLGDARMSNKSLTDEQKLILWDTIQNAQKRTGSKQGGTEYQDYGGLGYGDPKQYTEWFNKGNIPFLEGVAGTLKNPGFELASTIGRGNYKVDPNDPNTVTYTDVYDWNKGEKMFEGNKVYKVVRNALRKNEESNLNVEKNDPYRMNFKLNKNEIDQIRKKIHPVNVLDASAKMRVMPLMLNPFENGGWLEKYNDGGPVQENYNDYSVTVPPNYEGEGYFNEGRDYSPAWGGQFQDGGKTKKQPIYVTDKNDPRLKAYNDSLQAYNANEKKWKGWKPLTKEILHKAGADYPGNSYSQYIGNPNYVTKPDDSDYSFTWKDDVRKPKQPVVYQERVYQKETPELQDLQAGLPVNISLPELQRQKGPIRYTMGRPLFKGGPQTDYYTPIDEDGNVVNTPEFKTSQYAMGGSISGATQGIPGATGFMYARDSGSVPSKGKYAKKNIKTVASAQTGIALSKTESDKEAVAKSEERAKQEENLMTRAPLDIIEEGRSKFRYNMLEDAVRHDMALEKFTSLEDVDKKELKKKTRELLLARERKLANPTVEFVKGNGVFGDKLSVLGYYDPNNKGALVSLSDNLDKLSVDEFGNTVRHEFRHAYDDAGNLLTNYEKELIKNKTALGDVDKIQAIGRERYDYLTDPTEVTARLQEIRGALRDNPYTSGYLKKDKDSPISLYDKVDKEGYYLDDFTKQRIPIKRTYDARKDKARYEDLMFLNNEKHNSGLQDLLQVMSPQDIVDLLNTIAANNPQQGMPMAQNGAKMTYYQNGLDFQPKSISKNGKKVIKDDRGQWAHPGEITEIDSNQITMQGVPYPVLGISDLGDTQMMYPNEEYQFIGDSVTEYPMMKQGGQLTKLDQLTNFTNYNTKQPGGWLDKYQ